METRETGTRRRPAGPSGRRSSGTAALLAMLLLTGCGNRHVVVTVDLLSYLDPRVTEVAFGPVPVAPGGFYTGEQAIVKDVEVHLLDGADSIAEVQDVAITLTAIAADSTGAGEDTLRLYASGIDADPLATAPVLVLPIVLSPGVTDTVAVEVGVDTRVAALFAGKRMRLTLTTALRGPAAGDPLNARIRVAALEAVLVAGRRAL